MLRVPGRLRRFLQPMVPAESVLRAFRELPLADFDTLLGEGPVLVLAPHPDDESLGCGGLLAACRERGRPAYVLVLTDGAGSHPGSRQYPPEKLVALRQAEATEAAAALGLDAAHIGFLGLPDGQAPHRGKRFDAAVEQVAAHARARQIGTICTTWAHDPHPDHHATYRIGRRVAERIGAKLLCYPVWGWTIPPQAWLPAAPVRGARLDIAGHLPAKRRAIACHRSQLTDLIHDDPTGFRLSPEVLALFDRPFEVFSEA
jgi:LmbE family N-acetylglucosaminyl deacetylase